jgi:hypothetical protein
MTLITITPGNGKDPQEIQVASGVYLLLYEVDGEMQAAGNLGKLDWRVWLASAFQGAMGERLPSFMKR